jgi:hypothetical protein
MAKKPTMRTEDEAEIDKSAAADDAAKVEEGEAERQAAEENGQETMPIDEAERERRARAAETAQPAPFGGGAPVAGPSPEAALAGFIADFERAPPDLSGPEGYKSNVNDRWWGNRYNIADGDHPTEGGVLLTFRDGHFVRATGSK